MASFKASVSTFTPSPEDAAFQRLAPTLPGDSRAGMAKLSAATQGRTPPVTPADLVDRIPPRPQVTPIYPGQPNTPVSAGNQLIPHGSVPNWSAGGQPPIADKWTLGEKPPINLGDVGKSIGGMVKNAARGLVSAEAGAMMAPEVNKYMLGRDLAHGIDSSAALRAPFYFATHPSEVMRAMDAVKKAHDAPAEWKEIDFSHPSIDAHDMGPDAVNARAAGPWKEIDFSHPSINAHDMTAQSVGQRDSIKQYGSATSHGPGGNITYYRGPNGELMRSDGTNHTVLAGHGGIGEAYDKEDGFGHPGSHDNPLAREVIAKRQREAEAQQQAQFASMMADPGDSIGTMVAKKRNMAAYLQNQQNQGQLKVAGMRDATDRRGQDITMRGQDAQLEAGRASAAADAAWHEAQARDNAAGRDIQRAQLNFSQQQEKNRLQKEQDDKAAKVSSLRQLAQAYTDADADTTIGYPSEDKVRRIGMQRILTAPTTELESFDPTFFLARQVDRN